MDKTSKRVLKYLCKHNLYKNYAFFFVGDSYREIADDLNILEIELKQCISQLRADGYISYVFTGNNVTGFAITNKGLHYKEIFFRESAKAVIKYIAVPVVVAIISAIVLHELGLK